MVKDSKSGKEIELEGEWKMGRKSMIVKGCHRRSLKVGFRFKDKPELGTVYSELYKGAVCMCECMVLALFFSGLQACVASMIVGLLQILHIWSLQ